MQQASPSTSLRTSLLLFVLAFLAGMGVNRGILDDFPNSADEYAYLWQAQALAQGHLTGEIPQPRDTFALFHMGEGHMGERHMGERHLGEGQGAGQVGSATESFRFSRFPIGWPLLLTPGVWLGFPGLINPLLAALALLGLHRLALRHGGEKAALLGCVVVGASPFFLLNAGSYHSHPSSLCALVGMALALETALERRQHKHDDAGARWYALAGALFGLAVLIRPYTALLLGVPVFALSLVRSHPSGPETARTTSLRIGGFVLGGLPFAVILGLVNLIITGSPFQLPTTLIDPEEGLGFGVHGHTLQQGLQNTLLWSIEFLAYSFFMSPFLLLLARGRAGRLERFWWLLLVLPVVGYLFYWNPGGNRYGPRFWFEGLLPFALLVGVGLEHALSQRRYRLLVGIFGLIGVLGGGKLCGDARVQVQQRSAVYRAMAQAGLLEPGKKSVVLMLGSSADMPVYDLTRNPPVFRDAPVLLGRARGAADRDVAQVWPDRQIFTYRWNSEGGKIEPLNLASPLEPDPLPDL